TKPPWLFTPWPISCSTRVPIHSHSYSQESAFRPNFAVLAMELLRQLEKSELWSQEESWKLWQRTETDWSQFCQHSRQYCSSCPCSSGFSRMVLVSPVSRRAGRSSGKMQISSTKFGILG